MTGYESSAPAAFLEDSKTLCRLLGCDPCIWSINPKVLPSLTLTRVHATRPLLLLSAGETAGNFTGVTLGRNQINVVHGNVLDSDIAEATGVFVYLVPAGMLALKEALVSRLKAGARVVTYGEC